MAKIKANLLKVKVYPKDLKAIPDILPFNKLISGEPQELELDKREILRCMNFGDVFDMTSGEEVIIDKVAFLKIEEFVDVTEDDSTTEEDTTGESSSSTGTSTPEVSEPVVDETTDSTEESV